MTNSLKAIDPTRTKVMRDTFSARLRAQLFVVGTEMEAWFSDPTNWSVPTDEELTGNAQSRWSMLPKGAVLSRFKNWLKGLLAAQDLSATSDGFIEKAYNGGVVRAEDRILPPKTAEVPLPVRSAFRTGTFVERLAVLKTKAAENIKSMKDKLLGQVVDQVAEGMIAGQSPKQIGRDINKKWRHVSKVTATRIARTEVIRAHNEGQLDRMESLGVKKVGVEVEWNATKHADGSFEKRVCPKCRAMDGLVIPIERAHGLLPRHPNCRCSFIPALDDKPERSKIRSAVAASVKAGQSKKAKESPNPLREKGGWPGPAMAGYLGRKKKK